MGPEQLTVVIPTHGRGAILRRTLEALARQTVSGFEVVVVVDGTDQPRPDVTGIDLPVRVLVKEHGGPGAARNAGVAATERDLVLFLGDDMVPDDDLVQRHLERHSADARPEFGVLGLAVWHDDVAGDVLQRWLDWSGLQFDYHTIKGENAGWPRFYSCNVSLKRHFFLDAGGFDEAFTYYYEDLDAGYRFGEHGLDLVLERGAVTRHWHRYTWESIERRFAGIARGEHLMLAKHDWFTPWFKVRVDGAARQRRVLFPWQHAVRVLPAGSALRRKVERRATTRYLQRLAPHFMQAWAAAESAAPIPQRASGGPSG